MTQASHLHWRHACGHRRAARRRARAKPGGNPSVPPSAGHHAALSGWTRLLLSKGTGTLPKRGTSTLLSARLRRRGTGAGGTGTPPGEQLPRAQRSMTRWSGRQLRRRRVWRMLSGTARQGRRCQPCASGSVAELWEITYWPYMRRQAMLNLSQSQQQGRRACLLVPNTCMLAV